MGFNYFFVIAFSSSSSRGWNKFFPFLLVADETKLTTSDGFMSSTAGAKLRLTFSGKHICSSALPCWRMKTNYFCSGWCLLRLLLVCRCCCSLRLTTTKFWWIKCASSSNRTVGLSFQDIRGGIGCQNTWTWKLTFCSSSILFCVARREIFYLSRYQLSDEGLSLEVFAKKQKLRRVMSVWDF